MMDCFDVEESKEIKEQKENKNNAIPDHTHTDV